MKVTYQGGTRFVVRARGHKITVDLPPEKGGMDLGMTPTELFAGSLGACIGVYVSGYCQKAGLNCEGMTVEVDWETGGEPRHISHIRAEIHVPAGIPESRKAAVKKVAEHCFIHRALGTKPEMVIELT